MNKPLSWQSIARLGVIALAVITCLVAGFQLVTSLPWGQYTPLFWDCGALIEGIEHTGFPSGQGIEKIEYATLKYGYALPYYWLYQSAGMDATLLLNLFWFAVLLIAPLGSPLFRANGKTAWAGYSCYLAGTLSLPFVQKYIGMTNPTIQSMALWLLLALYYGRHREGSGLASRLMLVPGVLCGLLVLTDYKWLTFCVLGIVAIEICDEWSARTGDFSVTVRNSWKGIVARVSFAFLWVIVVLGVVSLFNPTYLPSVFKFVTSPGHFDAFRPALSWNLSIFLWVLGGFWLALWTGWRLWGSRSMILRGSDPQARTARRIIILAAIVVLSFSLLYWPRSARMFAPAVVLGLLLFGWQAQAVIEALVAPSRRIKVAMASLVLIVAGLGVRAVQSGELFRLPNGVRETTDFVMSHSSDFGSAPIGCFVPPVFNVPLEKPIECTFLASGIPDDMDWLILSDFVDLVIIDERQSFGLKHWLWRASAMEMKARIARESLLLASFPNDFYRSPYYVCESNYSDAELTFMLGQAEQVENPAWEIRYMGEMFGRPRPTILQNRP